MARILMCAAAVLLLQGYTSAQEAPGLVWERSYYTENSGATFNDIRQTTDGGFIVAGFIHTAEEDIFAIRLDSEGNLLWEIDPGWYRAFGQKVYQLADGSYVAVGYCRPTSAVNYALAFCGFSSSGALLWSRCYDLPDTDEYGHDILPVPGGEGYVICGSREGGTYDGLAWLLRTDSDGDTLWTRTWGGLTGINYMERAFLRGDTLVVFSHGASPDLPVGGPHALFYDLDGNLMGGTSYPEASGYLESICATQDGGYTLLVQPGSPTGSPQILHLEADYSLEWIYSYDDMSYSQMGYFVAGCMENGYVFSGWDGMLPDWESNSPYTRDGWIFRVDSLGQYMWQIENDLNYHNEFNCVRQLSDGGYIAAGYIVSSTGDGNDGYLLRYAPETGIEQDAENQDAICLHPCIPNPGTTTFSLSWSSDLSGLSTVRVYDVSGRPRLDQDLGMTPPGEHSTQLDLQDLPSGCYLVVVSCGSERASTKLVLLR